MIDKFLDRVWSRDYTCNDFACELWLELTGFDLSKRLLDNLSTGLEFIPLEDPESPCLVFLSNGNNLSTHIGIYYNGKIAHLSTNGAQLAPLEIVNMGFKNMEFYK